MKSPSSQVVFISLTCLFAIVFHSCHGIQCYFCNSKNYANKNCENISTDEFVHDYGRKVENCAKLLFWKKNETTGEQLRLLFRIGCAEKSKPDLDNTIKIHKESGYQTDSFVCKEDLCNGI